MLLYETIKDYEDYLLDKMKEILFSFVFMHNYSYLCTPKLNWEEIINT